MMKRKRKGHERGQKDIIFGGIYKPSPAEPAHILFNLGVTGQESKPVTLSQGV